jgi:hypothetical protein
MMTNECFKTLEMVKSGHTIEDVLSSVGSYLLLPSRESVAIREFDSNTSMIVVDGRDTDILIKRISGRWQARHLYLNHNVCMGNKAF